MILYRPMAGLKMVFKITISCNFINSVTVTTGNMYKLLQKHVYYNLTKFSFNNRIVPMHQHTSSTSCLLHDSPYLE